MAFRAMLILFLSGGYYGSGLERFGFDQDLRARKWVKMRQNISWESVKARTLACDSYPLSCSYAHTP